METIIKISAEAIEEIMARLGMEGEYDPNVDITRYTLPDGSIVFVGGEENEVVIESAE